MFNHRRQVPILAAARKIVSHQPTRYRSRAPRSRSSDDLQPWKPNDLAIAASCAEDLVQSSPPGPHTSSGAEDQYLESSDYTAIHFNPYHHSTHHFELPNNINIHGTQDESTATDVPDPYDNVYNNIPEETHMLKPVPNCGYCTAKKFEYESPGFCCRGGKVELAPLETPPQLKRLWDSTDSVARHFRDNIRFFNGHFSFTSLYCCLDNMTTNVRDSGIYTFWAQGMMYHNIKSFGREGGAEHKHLELYFYDDDPSLEHRYRKCRADQLQRDKEVIRQIVGILRGNPYSEHLRSMGHVENLDDYYIALNLDQTLNQKTYNAPLTSEVAAVWIEGSERRGRFSKSVMLHGKDRSNHGIRSYHGCYDALSYPLFFPKGELGWHANIPKVGVSMDEVDAYRAIHRASNANDEDDDMSHFRKKLAAILLSSYMNKRRGYPIYKYDKEVHTGSPSDVEILDSPTNHKKRKLLHVLDNSEVLMEDEDGPITQADLQRWFVDEWDKRTPTKVSADGCTDDFLMSGLSTKDMPVTKDDLIDVLCDYIMAIQDDRTLEMIWVRSFNPFKIEISVKDLQNILSINPDMTLKCFDMAVRLLANKESRRPKGEIIKNRKHYMDMRFWRMIGFGKLPKYHQDPTAEELTKTLDCWPSMNYYITACKYVLMPWKFNGCYALFVIDHGKKHVTFIDFAHIQDWCKHMPYKRLNTSYLILQAMAMWGNDSPMEFVRDAKVLRRNFIIELLSYEENSCRYAIPANIQQRVNNIIKKD
uniref:Helitron helicase-like domain-containing protein n=1 Tax=Zea mays TaxID=4577 RepID=A0A804NTL9_MAIZE